MNWTQYEEACFQCGKIIVGAIANDGEITDNVLCPTCAKLILKKDEGQPGPVHPLSIAAVLKRKAGRTV